MFFKMEKIHMENQRLALQSESESLDDEAAVAASNIPMMETVCAKSPLHLQPVAIGEVS